MYWTPFSDRAMEIADVEFSNGKKSVRLRADGGRAGIRQGRIFLDSGADMTGRRAYDASGGRRN